LIVKVRKMGKVYHAVQRPTNIKLVPADAERKEKELRLDPPLFVTCDLDQFRDPDKKRAANDACEELDKLDAQDEISVSSIISALLRPIEPSDDQFKECDWGIDPKQFLPTKQAVIFKEQLFISKLRNTNCKLNENLKIFFERELEQIGRFCLNVEESFDGYVIFSSSKMKKGKGMVECGHQLKGKYDDKFLLICEKRSEFDRIDNTRVEKTLELRNHADLMLTAIRETKINEEVQRFKARIDIKDRVHLSAPKLRQPVTCSLSLFKSSEGLLALQLVEEHVRHSSAPSACNSANFDGIVEPRGLFRVAHLRKFPESVT